MTDPRPRGSRGAVSGASDFDSIAPFYDELMLSVPYPMWADYYLLLLAHVDSRPKSLLDVCCGTGNVAELLCREGFEITGIDLSKEMIRVAKAKAALKGLNIAYQCADAVSFRLGARFDGAYSFFDSLNYVTDLARLRRALQNVAEHLRPGASFVFDLNTAYAFEQRLFDQSQLRPHRRLRYDWKGDWDPATRIIRVHMTFWIGDRKFEVTHDQRAHSEEEVRQALMDAGFHRVQCFHSYTLERPRRRSDRVHYAAIRCG